MALMQIGSTPISPVAPRSATLLFNRPARGLLPKFSRLSYYMILMKIPILPL